MSGVSLVLLQLGNLSNKRLTAGESRELFFQNKRSFVHESNILISQLPPGWRRACRGIGLLHGLDKLQAEGVRARFYIGYFAAKRQQSMVGVGVGGFPSSLGTFTCLLVRKPGRLHPTMC